MKEDLHLVPFSPPSNSQQHVFAPLYTLSSLQPLQSSSAPILINLFKCLLSKSQMISVFSNPVGSSLSVIYLKAPFTSVDHLFLELLGYHTFPSSFPHYLTLLSLLPGHLSIGVLKDSSQALSLFSPLVASPNSKTVNTAYTPMTP